MMLSAQPIIHIDTKSKIHCVMCCYSVTSPKSNCFINLTDREGRRISTQKKKKKKCRRILRHLSYTWLYRIDSSETSGTIFFPLPHLVQGSHSEVAIANSNSISISISISSVLLIDPCLCFLQYHFLITPY